MTRQALFAAMCWLAMSLQGTLAETKLVIDPTEGVEPQSPPAAAEKKPAQADPAVKRARSRAEEEKRRRAKAEARAQAAESEAAKLRALEQARRSEEAARDAAAKAAARKAAQARAAALQAAAVKAASARQAKYAAERAAVLREAAARETAAREAAARELAAREAAAKEAALREAAVRQAAAKEAAAKEAAAKEAAAKEAAAREAAASEAAARLVAAREAAAKESSVRFASAQAAMRKEVRMPGPHGLGTVFRDCNDCPELVWLPQGEFVHALAVGRFEVTFAQWDACVAAAGCSRRPQDSGWGRGWQPVINVSWSDAQQYVAWLARRTGKRYRLLNEAEWEYAARAGSDANYWWGNQIGRGDANCADCGSKWDGRQAAPVGRFAPNPFGLYDMHGNVSEWVEDRYDDGRRDTPGAARIVKGGAWRDSAKSIRSTWRASAAYDFLDNRIGFRVARTD